jgi:phospholipid-transporting ATPase
MDKDANNALVQVVLEGQLRKIHSKDVQVGDIVKCKKNDRFPADLVLISSSEPQGIAYIETSNVDGESNLKIRMSNTRTTHFVNEETISEFNATIQCEHPNERIYNFEGNMDNGKERFSLDRSNILLRGAVLKNTSWIYGIVVYTGHESKIMMNSSETPNKSTRMARKTDQKYFYLVIGVGILALFGALCNMYFDTEILTQHWYLNIPNHSGIKKNWNVISFGKMVLSYIFLLNTLVPISLSVTLEFIKLLMAYLVNQDLELYDAETDCNAVARSSNLMEELGQIQCILTDKTGTLTCNEMILKHLIIDGKTYLNCSEFGSELLDSSGINEKVDFFLKVLSTCHTIMIDYSDPDHPCYQGSSPDELAMVNVAAELAYKFSKRSTGTITIEIRGKPVTIEVFAVIEFTSSRKRMSIVALLPDDNYYLFCKGADSIIFDRLEPKSKDSQELKNSLKGLENFASAGLRTLCFASRKLDKDFALEWLDKWNDALNTVTDRQEQIDSVAQLIETDLSFIGATGVEDRLQDGVPKTIETLMKANIKFWMLTGDRFETAVSTAFLSNLIQSSTVQLHLLFNEPSAISESLDNFLELIDKSSSRSNFALVLNGPVVEVVLSDSFLKSQDFKKFRKIVTKCRTLLCCRLSPLQKSLITKFARENLGYTTLAIGDGGNDVSMIQAANVGVGISGKEGLQASRSADFSIAQFKFLVKLVLVHGSWSLHRLSRVVMYSIYKNFVLFFTQFWFCFYNGFSARSIFEPWMFINWNMVFTCWPPTIIGLTDQYVFAWELIENPQLYEFGQKNKFVSIKKIIK